MKPGSKVTMRSMAMSLGLGLTPVREALMRLVSENALQMKGPKTIVVPTYTKEEFAELAAIRQELEGLAAQIAAQNVSSADIDELEAIHIGYSTSRAAGDFASALQLHERFHFTLYQKSNLNRLCALIEGLWVSSGPHVSKLFPGFASNLEGPIAHRKAIAALRNKDPDGVRAAIVEDIVLGEKKISQMLDKALD